MLQVYDKDLGTMMDLREIIDITIDDFKDNQQIFEMLQYINLRNPIQTSNVDLTVTENINCEKQTFFNSKLSSYAIGSKLTSTNALYS